jgi:hypothetical protein
MALPPVTPRTAPVVDRTGVAVATTANYLADVWRDPYARGQFNTAFAYPNIPPAEDGAFRDTLIVGGGIHAAIYAAAAGGSIRVIESRSFGGVFAITNAQTGEVVAVFYLNSRNRCGDLDLPGRGGGLNVIPGGIVQPADLDGAEYQTNAELAFAIRANLAQFAELRFGIVTKIAKDDSNTTSLYRVTTSADSRTRANRVILATGLGSPNIENAAELPCVLSFDDLVRRVGNTAFPYQGWENVAVVGAADSGDATIKSMLGQGPSTPSPASLDTIRHIDWYGQRCTSKEQFERGARSCNAGIGRYMRRLEDPDYDYRIEAYPYRVTSVVPNRGGDGARVVYTENGRDLLSPPYDHVVLCTGFKGNNIDIDPLVDVTLTPSARDRGVGLREEIVYDEDGTALGRHYVGTEIYKVGPCADLPVTDAERRAAPALADIPVNSAAIWRYAGRTRRLAEILTQA